MSHPEAAPHEAEGKAKRKSGPGLLVWLVLAILAIGGGLATPVLASKFLGSPESGKDGHEDGKHGEEGEHGEEEHGEEGPEDDAADDHGGGGHGDSGQGGGGHGGGHGEVAKIIPKFGKVKFPKPSKYPAFIEFDELIVNLDESRFNRYLKVVFSLQVAENHRGDVESLIEGKKAILKNWLISHLADKSLDDIKGKFGHSRLRREISDYFNQQLFEDGVERIQDILFKELNVQ